MRSIRLGHSLRDMVVAPSPDGSARLSRDAGEQGLEITPEPSVGRAATERPVARPGVVAASPPDVLAGEPPTAATVQDEHEDRHWTVWWGTFANAPGVRIHVWRVQDNGLNAARPILVLTVEDAQREGLARRVAFLDYLAERFGAGRFRLSPRSSNGERPRGAQSLTVFIPEESAMQVVMRPAQTSQPPVASPADRETLIEVERMRLVAEREREREDVHLTRLHSVEIVGSCRGSRLLPRAA